MAQGAPYLRVANVQRGYIDLTEIKHLEVFPPEMGKYRLEPGDILLCEGNSADLVGRGAIWHGEIAECVHQNHVLRVRLDSQRALSEYVLAYINSNAGQAYFRSKAKRTTNLASINSREVAQMPIPLPPLDVQHEIVRRVQAGRAEIARLREQAARRAQAAQAEVEAAILGVAS
ncbi:MAG: restriction endonuclease subunit S [Anaerolineae bacterium]|nr:restriction endonuclease subunit S [Anaerolineae bacterium]